MPVPVNTQKQHFLDFTDDIDIVGNNNNEELDAQQLLGNLCCASDGKREINFKRDFIRVGPS